MEYQCECCGESLSAELVDRIAREQLSEFGRQGQAMRAARSGGQRGGRPYSSAPRCLCGRFTLERAIALEHRCPPTEHRPVPQPQIINKWGLSAAGSLARGVQGESGWVDEQVPGRGPYEEVGIFDPRVPPEARQWAESLLKL